MIQIKIKSKKYKNKEILKELNYTFNDTGLYIIKGYNGCGKTTLLNIIALLDSNYNGSININGIEINSNPFFRSNIRKKYISYILPTDNLISFLSIKDNILQESTNLEDSLLQGIDLNKKKNQISGGQEMLAVISKFINSKKPIGLLDEVTSQLDEKNTKLVMKKLLSISKNKLIIFATHDSRILEMPELNILTLEGGNIYD